MKQNSRKKNQKPPGSTLGYTTRLFLYRLVRDNQTYSAFKREFDSSNAQTDKEKERIPVSYDSYRRLRRVLPQMPPEEAHLLPPDLESWILGLGPKLPQEQTSGNLETGHDAEPYQETPQVSEDAATLGQLETAQRIRLSEFISTFSLPSPFIREATDMFLFSERTPGFPGYDYALVYTGQFPLPDLTEYLTWLKHPLLDQTKKLLGDATARLEDFVTDFGTLLESCQSLMQQIYSACLSAVPPFVKLDEASNNFAPYVYSDAVRFFLGERLDPIHPRYYDCQPFGDLSQVNIPGQATIASFEDKHGGIDICAQIRDAHMQLRQTYRMSQDVNDLVQTMYALEVQREALQGELKTFIKVLRSIPG